jgi:quercetin 2,3-dioxygenase
MDAYRKLSRVVSPPPPAPGFIGPGHTAVEVLEPGALEESDPFVLLMDDRLDIQPRRAIGGAHPHAGLETVTLILEGSLSDRDEGTLSAGDAIWMTAGRGIIHNEHVEVEGRARILQLWVRLPKAERAAPPRFEIIHGAGLPVRREAGAVARLYSGTTGALRSPTLNHVPVTLVDLALAPGATFEQALPAAYNGFVYVVDGRLRGGDDAASLTQGQVGWLDRPTRAGDSVLRLSAHDEGARVVLYAGAPQREPIIQRGPFVADDEAGLIRMHHDYRAGLFVRLSDLTPVS